ncbi:MAG: DUF2339 domain-containing protein [Defluviimonas denitrificans]
MEFLLVVAALVFLALPIVVIVLMVSVSGLKRRIEMLERQVRDLAAAPRAAAPMAATAAPVAETVASPPATVAEAPQAEAVPEAPQPEVPQPEATPEVPQPEAQAPAAPQPAPRDPWGVPADPERPHAASQARAARLAPSGPSAVDRLGAWLKINWVYAVSALSLALAGIFFVQYGIENGLLPPAARVTAAILFGLALIGAGEWLRRRWGDRAEDTTAYLPSTFSGAGLVSIFGGIIAARQLYDLIGQGTAFAGLLATALLAVVLGWFYGPFLAAVGLVGAAVAPFVVGGASEAPYWLYGYFALIAGVGLFVDTIRRWAWVSVLAVAIGIAGGGLVYVSTGGVGWFMLMLVAMVFLVVCVPARGLMPDHAGAMTIAALRGKGGEMPIFPTLLAAGTVAVASFLLLVLDSNTVAESLMAYICLAGLALALTVWSGGARALSDLTVLPVAAFLLRLGFEGVSSGPLQQDFLSRAVAVRPPETSAPLTATLLLAIATLITLGAAWISGGAGRLKPFWAAGAALTAPVAALVMELWWGPSWVLGAYPWALHVIALAALMVGLAVVFARADGEDMRRAAYATLSALSLIALALFLVTTKGALTLALAALLVSAAALDRRFRLPEMGWFVQAGVLVLGYRLTIDPGLDWAVNDAALWEVIASYAGGALAAFAALSLIRDLDRPGAKAFLESGGASAAALLVNVLITRWLLNSGGGEDLLASHWAVALNAMPWLIVALAQLYRMQLGGWMRWVRIAIAGVAGLIWGGGTLVTLTLVNPLFADWFGDGHLVRGPLLLDTLLVAYALPGLMLIGVGRFFGHLPGLVRAPLVLLGTGLVAFYAALEIRRFWRGPDLSVPGVTQAELYSYTVALMLLGAALLYQAIARRSQGLRRIAMAVIALTIAKVFLIDASGLTGLTRVFSFLALGLSLAGLAWLNRWAAGQGEAQGEDQGKG